MVPFGVWDPSIHPFLLTLPVCGSGIVMQVWGTSYSLEDSWLKPRSCNYPKPVRGRWGGVKRCLCSPLAQGWSFIILLGTWEKCQQSLQDPEAWECSYRTGAFHVTEAGREEALSLPPSLDTNTPILLHSPGSWLSQPERWASVPVMSCVTAAKYQGLSAASFCKMILLNTVSLDNKCQEHNLSC